MSNGILNTIFNTSTIDKSAVREYNEKIEKAISNGATMTEKQKIMKSAMEGKNKATAQLIGSTKEADITLESITFEIKTLEEKLDELDAQAGNSKQASKYKVTESESFFGGYETYAVSVTKDEELLNAIEAYDEYKAKVDEANKALAEMEQTGNYSQKEWKKQEKIVEKYSQKMEDAHANELALTLSEQKQGLNGSTEASQELIDTVDRTLDTYSGWLNVINNTTDAK